MQIPDVPWPHPYRSSVAVQGGAGRGRGELGSAGSTPTFQLGPDSGSWVWQLPRTERRPLRFPKAVGSSYEFCGIQGFHYKERDPNSSGLFCPAIH